MSKTKMIFSLLPVPRPVKEPPGSFILGSAKGAVTVPDDFNDPLPKEF
jgi:hypothetical protein